MDGYKAIVLLVYGSLTLAWGYIILFSWRNMVSELARNSLLLLLFTILMLDAARHPGGEWLFWHDVRLTVWRLA